MRHASVLVLLAVAIALPVPASAQSEADRLREALRSCTSQLRSAEDQRAVLQARLAEAERERDRLRKQNEILRAQVKDAEEAYRKAVKDFNERLSERDDVLEKWRSAFDEAATVARAKEAERAKLEQEAAALKTSNKGCEAKNIQLHKTGLEILRRYERMNLLERGIVHDPVLGLKRVEHQNTVQEYRDKILDQKVRP